MNEHAELLEFAKNAVRSAAAEFQACGHDFLGQVRGTELGGRETKLVADAFLEDSLTNRLSETGLSLLSEESGLIERGTENDLRWVIDPLDGSVNYLRGSGPCAISVALCRNNQPVFGVLYTLNNQTLSWGGEGIGAWSGGDAIRVSTTKSAAEGLICAGIPARFRTNDQNALNSYFQLISRFAKVRMLGSAASSLLLVARGAADAYCEQQIMFWDVAAGLAIVQGAGGAFDVRQTGSVDPCTVLATNKQISLEF
jgi:myo-inositol-1(or 4)-monophosphatase